MDWVVLLAGMLIACGIVILYRIVDRGHIEDTNLYVVMTAGAVLILGGLYMIFSSIPAEVVKRKIYGFVLTVFGFWLTFKFPDAREYQGADMSVAGMIFGIIMLVLGLYWFMF